MDKLKPCPFCGHEAMISYNSNYDFQAYCTNDSCFMSQIIMEDMETEEQARAAWNKRAPSVLAVPLGPLCEWLGKVAIFRCCECTSNCCDGEECSSPNHFDKEIKKWMEGLDAKADT